MLGWLSVSQRGELRVLGRRPVVIRVRISSRSSHRPFVRSRYRLSVVDVSSDVFSIERVTFGDPASYHRAKTLATTGNR